ncbi:MAG TPA: GNAT family N-acetyltransferase [Burkholderiaceae bacterium]|nr:GNAT family N-acetyltransferase [Burkholderiaceae bacterium]
MTAPTTSALVRPSVDADIAAITRIYAHHVMHGTGTFETSAPTEDDMRARRADVLGKNLPWLVIEQAGHVMGFAYGNWFKPRPAYRFSVEDSIYMAPNAAGKGLGKQLLTELLAQLERRGIRKVMAVIGDSANAGSIGVHRSLGFTQVGVVSSCGWKFGRWLDIVMMEKPLGAGDSTPPEGAA